jgi:hypothetical protein
MRFGWVGDLNETLDEHIAGHIRLLRERVGDYNGAYNIQTNLQNVD